MEASQELGAFLERAELYTREQITSGQSPIFDGLLEWLAGILLSKKRYRWFSINDLPMMESQQSNPYDKTYIPIAQYTLVAELLNSELSHSAGKNLADDGQDTGRGLLLNEAVCVAEGLLEIELVRQFESDLKGFDKENVFLNLDKTRSGAKQYVANFGLLDLHGVVRDRVFDKCRRSPGLSRGLAALYGSRAALDAFPDSPFKGEWLEWDLGV